MVKIAICSCGTTCFLKYSCCGEERVFLISILLQIYETNIRIEVE